MAIYTAPSMSFIDTYINSANKLDERRDKSNQALLEGTANLVKGGAEAYKWQQRKNIADEADELDKREKEILAELADLKANRRIDTQNNMSAILDNSYWKGLPYPYAPKAEWQGIPYKFDPKADEFVAPTVGKKKELI